MTRLLMVTEADGSIELTSGSTTRLITPSARTVGVNARLTPNGLNSTVIAELPPFDPLACETGIGNSPPARKLAVSPDKAIRVGSARVVTTPLFSSASSVTLKSAPNARKVRDMIAKLSTIDPNLATGAPGSVVVLTDPSGFVIVVVVDRPGVRLAPLPMTPTVLSPRIPQLRPSWVSAERLISAKRTSSITCCDEPSESRFTTLPGA